MLRITMEIPGEPEAIEQALEGLIGVNMALMRGRRFPAVYDTKLRYRLEPAGQDDWQTYDRLLQAGEGDCEDFVGARVAELRLAGELGARPRVVPVPGRSDAFHTFVQRQDGSIDDPSKVMIYKEQTMANDKPKICLRDVGQHTLGVIEVPLVDGRTATVQQLGFDAWGAIAGVFHEITSNPGLMALISPQAAVAITVAKRIAEMSPDDLKKLSKDPAAPDNQKKLASEVLKSKTGSTAATATTASVSDWTPSGRPSSGVGAVDMKAPPYYGPGAPPVVRVHTPGDVTPSRATQATMTVVPGASQGAHVVMPVSMMPPSAAPPGTTAATVTSPATGTRVTGGSTTQPDATTAPIDPTTGAYMAPDGSPFVWIPGTDADHPGHWARQSGIPPGQPGGLPLPMPAPGGMPLPPGYGYPPGVLPPGYSPPISYPPGYGYPPGMMPPAYPPGMMPPVWGVDPSAMQYGYPYPYGSPYGAGGSPYTPYMPPGWWGGAPGQGPEPLSLDEAAAVTVWGAQSFAQGSFPGYI